jgi:formylglycine-generating enzyme required for sulfatase activity
MLMPNPLGLFDVLGNVYEWCHDPMAPFRPAPDGGVLNDDGGPLEPIAGDSHRVMRGGAYHRDPSALRSASRHDTTAGDPNLRVGFRVARTWRQSAN